MVTHNGLIAKLFLSDYKKKGQHVIVRIFFFYKGRDE